MTLFARLARSLSITTVAGALFGLAILAPTPAAAQYGAAAGFAEVMSPHYLRRDLRIFEEGLSLDPAQAAILQSLFWDYEARHEASRQNMMSRIETLRDDLVNLDRTQQIRLIFEPFIAQADDWENQRNQFLQDVQYILNEQQQQAWPEFLKRLRREKELPKGELAGERTDLTVILRQLTLPAGAARPLESVLEGYTAELDQALQARERDISQSRITLMMSMRDEDQQTSLRLYRRQLDLRRAVRDVNDRYIELIAAELPAEYGRQFRAGALEAGYPRIFRPTPAHRVLDAALRLRDLDPEIEARVDELYAIFQSQLDEFNTRLLSTLRDFEPRDAIRRAELSAAPRAGSGTSQPVRDEAQAVFAERDEMTRRHVNMLQDILGDELFLSLPGANRFFRSLNNAPMQGQIGDQQLDESQILRQKRQEQRRQDEERSRRPIDSPGGSARPN